MVSLDTLIKRATAGGLTSRIQDPIRVHHRFDFLHQFHRAETQFTLEILAFAKTDAVFARASAVEIDRAVDHAMCGGVRLGKVFLAENETAVNVAVADVSKQKVGAKEFRTKCCIMKVFRRSPEHRPDQSMLL